VSISPELKSAYVRAAVCLCMAAAASFGTAAAAAAQTAPGAPCSLVLDAVIAPAHAIETVKVPGFESCAVQDGAATPITILHISGPIDPADVTDQGQGPGAAPPIESTPVGGIGDSAVLLRIPVDDETLVSLRVQRGDDVYAFNGADAPETPDRLLSLAKAVLGGATANGF
jgi:hypothetical protein